MQSRHSKKSKRRDDLILRREVAAIRRLKKSVASHGKSVVTDIVEIGKRLERVKGRIGHGNWLPWLRKNFDWSGETAANYMAVYRLSKSPKFLSLKNLPFDQLYMLGRRSVSEEVRAAVAARVEARGQITPSEVRNIHIGPRYTVPEPQPERLSIRSAEHDAPAPTLPAITSEVLQAASRRHLIYLIVDVTQQLPPEPSIEEARAVIASAIADHKRDSFSAAVATLGEFVDQLRRVLNERLIDVSASK